MERNRRAIAGYNSILEYLPAYWMRREMDGKHIPSKWRMFADGGYKIRTRSITPGGFGRHCGTFHRLRENGREPEKEGAGRRDVQEVCEVPIRVRAPGYGHKGRRQLVYYYKQKLPATENTKKIDLTLDGLILSKDETRTELPRRHADILCQQHGAVP